MITGKNLLASYSQLLAATPHFSAVAYGFKKLLYNVLFFPVQNDSHPGNAQISYKIITATIY
jgi:hypothetical protein